MKIFIFFSLLVSGFRVVDCAPRRYCQGCEAWLVTPRYFFWYGTEDFSFCKICYNRMTRNGYTVIHPSWLSFYEHRHAEDDTGCMMFCARVRADVSAFYQVAALLRQNVRDGIEACMIFGLAYHLYWAAPMVSYVTLLLSTSSRSLNRYRACSRQVLSMYSGCRYNHGVLVVDAGGVGLHPCRNPKERTTPLYQLHVAFRHFSQYRTLCSRVVEYFSGPGVAVASIADLYAVVSAHAGGIYPPRKCYTTIRFCRSLVYYYGRRHADLERDWDVLRCMSGEVKTKVAQLGLVMYSSALVFRDGMRTITNDVSYNLMDLVIYICLMPQ